MGKKKVGSVQLDPGNGERRKAGTAQVQVCPEMEPESKGNVWVTI